MLSGRAGTSAHSVPLLGQEPAQDPVREQA